jgi:tetratricopeptide (TPR) repeat protein
MKALTIQSELYFGRNENHQALNGFQTLTALRRDGRHWFFRGLVEQNLGNTDESIRSLEQSLKINPENRGAHAALAAIYQLLKNDAKAESHRTMSATLEAKK